MGPEQGPFLSESKGGIHKTSVKIGLIKYSSSRVLSKDSVSG